MRLKNGMSAEEIKKELLNNSVKKNENRQIQTNLLYSKDLEYTTDNLFDDGNYLLPASAVKDYVLYKDYAKYDINDFELKVIVSDSSGQYDNSGSKSRVYLNPNSKRFVSKIKVILNLKDNQFKEINNDFEYVINTCFHRNTIWHKDIAVGYINENNNNYFCLFVENNNEIIVFNDDILDNLDIIIEIEG